jgi:hypothetical protein
LQFLTRNIKGSIDSRQLIRPSFFEKRDFFLMRAKHCISLLLKETIDIARGLFRAAVGPYTTIADSNCRIEISGARKLSRNIHRFAIVGVDGSEHSLGSCSPLLVEVIELSFVALFHCREFSIMIAIRLITLCLLALLRVL